MGFRNLSFQDSLKAFSGDVAYSKAELEAAVAAEREACAQIVSQGHWKPAVRSVLVERAAAIPARGQK